MTTTNPVQVIVLGATSAIASAAARIYAEEDKARILLAGRNERRLREMAADLEARGASKVEIAVTELAQASSAQLQMQEYVKALGGVDHVLIAYGLLGEQSSANRDLVEANEILTVNFTSAALWSLATANILERQGSGSLVLFGSVAGDRGRRNNFIYGSAKAGIATLVEGIAHRFASRGPRAVIIKIGPTISPMTAHMTHKGALWAQPEQVARVIHARASRGGLVAYAPARWWFIMNIIRHLPNFVFNRMDI